MDFDLNTFHDVTGGFKTVPDNFMPATGARPLLLEDSFLLWCQFHGRDHDFEKIEKEILLPTDKFIFIVPEYNGSFPGTLKMLVDTSRSNQIWWHKKAMLTGVSTGRAGNLRGMDHFATILNYLKITVYPNLLPISSVDKLLDAQEQFSDNNTLIAIHQQLDGFIEWSNQ